MSRDRDAFMHRPMSYRGGDQGLGGNISELRARFDQKRKQRAEGRARDEAAMAIQRLFRRAIGRKRRQYELVSCMTSFQELNLERSTLEELRLSSADGCSYFLQTTGRHPDNLAALFHSFFRSQYVDRSLFAEAFSDGMSMELFYIGMITWFHSVRHMFQRVSSGDEETNIDMVRNQVYADWGKDNGRSRNNMKRCCSGDKKGRCMCVDNGLQLTLTDMLSPFIKLGPMLESARRALRCSVRRDVDEEYLTLYEGNPGVADRFNSYILPIARCISIIPNKEGVMSVFDGKNDFTFKEACAIWEPQVDDLQTTFGMVPWLEDCHKVMSRRLLLSINSPKICGKSFWLSEVVLEEVRQLMAGDWTEHKKQNSRELKDGVVFSYKDKTRNPLKRGEFFSMLRGIRELVLGLEPLWILNRFLYANRISDCGDPSKVAVTGDPPKEELPKANKEEEKGSLWTMTRHAFGDLGLRSPEIKKPNEAWKPDGYITSAVRFAARGRRGSAGHELIRVRPVRDSVADILNGVESSLAWVKEFLMDIRPPPSEGITCTSYAQLPTLVTLRDFWLSWLSCLTVISPMYFMTYDTAKWIIQFYEMSIAEHYPHRYRCAMQDGNKIAKALENACGEAEGVPAARKLHQFWSSAPGRYCTPEFLSNTLNKYDNISDLRGFREPLSAKWEAALLSNAHEPILDVYIRSLLAAMNSLEERGTDQHIELLPALAYAATCVQLGLQSQVWGRMRGILLTGDLKDDLFLLVSRKSARVATTIVFGGMWWCGRENEIEMNDSVFYNPPADRYDWFMPLIDRMPLGDPFSNDVACKKIYYIQAITSCAADIIADLGNDSRSEGGPSVYVESLVEELYGWLEHGMRSGPLAMGTMTKTPVPSKGVDAESSNVSGDDTDTEPTFLPDDQLFLSLMGEGFIYLRSDGSSVNSEVKSKRKLNMCLIPALAALTRIVSKGYSSWEFFSRSMIAVAWKTLENLWLSMSTKKSTLDFLPHYATLCVLSTLFGAKGDSIHFSSDDAKFIEDFYAWRFYYRDNWGRTEKPVAIMEFKDYFHTSDMSYFRGPNDDHPGWLLHFAPRLIPLEKRFVSAGITQRRSYPMAWEAIPTAPTEDQMVTIKRAAPFTSTIAELVYRADVDTKHRPYFRWRNIDGNNEDGLDHGGLFQEVLEEFVPRIVQATSIDSRGTIFCERLAATDRRIMAYQAFGLLAAMAFPDGYCPIALSHSNFRRQAPNATTRLADLLDHDVGPHFLLSNCYDKSRRNAMRKPMGYLKADSILREVFEMTEMEFRAKRFLYSFKEDNEDVRFFWDAGSSKEEVTAETLGNEETVSHQQKKIEEYLQYDKTHRVDLLVKSQTYEFPLSAQLGNLATDSDFFPAARWFRRDHLFDYVEFWSLFQWASIFDSTFFLKGFTAICGHEHWKSMDPDDISMTVVFGSSHQFDMVDFISRVRWKGPGLDETQKEYVKNSCITMSANRMPSLLRFWGAQSRPDIEGIDGWVIEIRTPEGVGVDRWISASTCTLTLYVPPTKTQGEMDTAFERITENRFGFELV